MLVLLDLRCCCNSMAEAAIGTALLRKPTSREENIDEVWVTEVIKELQCMLVSTSAQLTKFYNTFNIRHCGFALDGETQEIIGSKPLQIWDKKVRNGHIKRITDNDIQSLVLEVEGTNVSTTYITCPADPNKTLGIKLPFLVLIIKNLKKYFTFEVQVLDDENVRRRIRASNYQSTTRVNPFICTMPMRLDKGWNQIQFNLSDFMRRAYGTNYIETLRVQIHANCRIRRVYFSDRLYSEDELPAEFKLYLPVQNKAKGDALCSGIAAWDPGAQEQGTQGLKPSGIKRKGREGCNVWRLAAQQHKHGRYGRTG
ncbi:cilia- and flagella-associated protein 20-like [Scleropages formosus]|uniref:Cilia-and flagella-associated protein 20-like n=1 Tax=Scleropages formosus TaxID=113540 RepID=A0A0P7VEP0_SCLFO|nr:cilia- and flagella-associated protein 20-like [Scleropages formosus]